MQRHELEQWLCGPDMPPASPASVAQSLRLPSSVLADTTFVRTASRVVSLRFTLAVLRDAFADDCQMRQWLDTSRDELGGSTPAYALGAGRYESVETLAVQLWNEAACFSHAV